MPLARIWMGRRIRFGTGVVILRRFFRHGVGRSDVRLMDECIVTDHGEDYQLRGAFADDNLNDLSWWTEKHLNYAIREAVAMLETKFNLSPTIELEQWRKLGRSSTSKRRKKLGYARLPLFWRALAYFIYRYFFRLGFLEGRQGFCWHFFQGLWYRMMVDAKLYEIQRACGNDLEKIRNYILKYYQITLG